MRPTTDQLAHMHAFLDRISPILDTLWAPCSHIFSVQQFGRDEYLLRAGDIGTYAYYVDEGLVRLFYTNDSGREFIKSFSTADDFCGSFSSSLFKTPCRFSIQALELTTVVYTLFDQIVDLFPTDIRWERLGRKLAEGYALLKEEREAELLLDPAETRYRRFLEDYPDLDQRIPQYHIASYLGITDVALSRIRKKMRGY
tara:strand:- start:138 stop:734 length:597 start_codon:yes stop_codon:yes gene_type:complete